MQITCFINGSQVNIDNEDFSFDFVSADGSPNAILLNDLTISLSGGSDVSPQNGVRLIDLYLQQNPPTKDLNVKLLHNILGVIFDGKGLLASQNTQFTKSEVELYCISTFEDFVKKSSQLNLRSLYKNNNITREKRFEDSDFQECFYILAQVPDYAQSAVMILTIAFLTQTVIDLTKDIIDAQGTVSVSMIITTAVKIVLVAINVITLLDGLYNALYQKPYRYYSVGIYELIEKGCANIGLAFKSDFLRQNYKDLYTIGETDIEGASGGKKPRNNPIPNISLSDLLAEIRKLFNTRVKVINGVVILERIDYFFANPANFTIEEMQDDALASYNIEEIPMNYSFNYAIDETEKNTLLEENRVSIGGDGVRGLSVKYDIPQMSILGLSAPAENVESMFARFFHKTKTTALERLFNGIFDTFQRIINGQNPLQGNRVGMGVLETHIIAKPKLFMLNKAKKRIDMQREPNLHALHIYNTHQRLTSIAGAFGAKTYYNVQGPNGIYSDISGNPDIFLTALRQNNICFSWFGSVAYVTKHIFNATTNLHEYEFYVLGWRNRLGDKHTNIPFVVKENIVFE